MVSDDIYTIVGDGTQGSGGDGGAPTSSQLSFPESIAIDSIGDLAIADAANNRVQFVPARSGVFFGPSMTAGDVYTIAGTGQSGFSGDGGPATSATLSDPAGVAIDATGDVLIADVEDHRVRMVTGQIPPPPTSGGGGPGGSGGPGGPGVGAATKVRAREGERRAHGDLVLVLSVPGPGALSATATFSAHRRRSHAGHATRARTVTYGSVTVTVSRSGTITIRCKVRRGAKRYIARGHKLGVALRIGFRPTGRDGRQPGLPRPRAAVAQGPIQLDLVEPREESALRGVGVANGRRGRDPDLLDDPVADLEHRVAGSGTEVPDVAPDPEPCIKRATSPRPTRSTSRERRRRCRRTCLRSAATQPCSPGSRPGSPNRRRGRSCQTRSAGC